MAPAMPPSPPAMKCTSPFFFFTVTACWLAEEEVVVVEAEAEEAEGVVNDVCGCSRAVGGGCWISVPTSRSSMRRPSFMGAPFTMAERKEERKEEKEGSWKELAQKPRGKDKKSTTNSFASTQCFQLIPITKRKVSKPRNGNDKVPLDSGSCRRWKSTHELVMRAAVEHFLLLLHLPPSPSPFSSSSPRFFSESNATGLFVKWVPW